MSGSAMKWSDESMCLASGFDAKMLKLRYEKYIVHTIEGPVVRKLVEFDGYLVDRSTGQAYDPMTKACMSSDQLRLGERIHG